MQILQGKYLKSVESAKGRLKGIQLKTAAGKQFVEIPKALRAIAQAELTRGDDVRIWAQPPAKKDKKRRKASKGKKLTAVQIVPLSPKTRVSAPQAVKKTKHKQKADKKLTVQLCQKKNCCRKGGDDLWSAFEAAAQNAKTSSEIKDFKLEAVGCLGGCKNGPNIRLLPANVKHRSVKPSDIKSLIGNRT